MKANEAPKKIWVHELSAMELNVPLKEYHVEYVRADAFINKALAYLNEKFYFNNLHYAVENNSFNSMEEMYEDFRKYMEG